ncbi:MAG: translation initiation factor IF-2 N-terminal domain-containing protein [Evtepia gabavorous]
MSFEKYRVHEVAKDFGKQTKDITQILTTYATTPKNHMQVLDDKELSIIFEYLTQHNQVADLQAVFRQRPQGGGRRQKRPPPGQPGQRPEAGPAEAG